MPANKITTNTAAVTVRVISIFRFNAIKKSLSVNRKGYLIVCLNNYSETFIAS